MPSCDWGGACDCRECRTTRRNETCEKCGFKTLVTVEGSGPRRIDRKGVAYFDFEYPETPAMELTCRRCGTVSKVAFYTAVDEAACRRRLAAET